MSSAYIKTFKFPNDDTVYEVQDAFAREKLDNKLDKNQSVENAGKFLTIDSNGNIVPSDTIQASTESNVVVDDETKITSDTLLYIDPDSIPDKIPERFYGTEVTGTGSGISVSVSGADAGDEYLNTDTGNLYIMNAAGKWDYVLCYSNFNNKFAGKVYNALGDSQTEANYHKTLIYHDIVKEHFALSEVNNYGVSGTTIAKKNSSDTTAMCVRYANMSNDAELITVMGGVNDFWFSLPMGVLGDTDPLTFYGGMDILCDGLTTKYSNKTVIFITPTNQAKLDNINSAGYCVADYANAAKRVCAKYSIPVYDANACSGIYPPNIKNSNLYTTDRLHLNNEGHKLLGNKLCNFISHGALTTVIDSSQSIKPYFAGKTFIAMGLKYTTMYHLTAVIALKSDMVGKTLETNLQISNAVNMASSTFNNAGLYTAKDCVLSNTSSYVSRASSADAIYTQTVNDSAVTIDVPPRIITIADADYLRVPVPLYGSLSFSFRIDDFTIKVNGVGQEILGIGGFFTEETFALG